MKVIDRFNEVEAFGENKSIDEILNFVYSHRIYIENVLDENFPNDILNATNRFMEIDEYDGCERSAWGRFLNSDMEKLLNN